MKFHSNHLVIFLIIALIVLADYFVYDVTKDRYIEKVNTEWELKALASQKLGEINMLNAIYLQAQNGELNIRNIVIENGFVVVDEDGNFIRGELITLVEEGEE